MVGILLVILACLFWGMDTLIRYPLVENGFHPLSLVFHEHILLTLIFSLSIIRNIKSFGNLRLADFFSFFVIGGIGSAIGTFAFTESFKYLNPSLVILLQKFQPIVAIVLASIILNEKLEKKFLTWAGVCLIGGLLVSFPHLYRFYELIINDTARVTSDVALKGYFWVGISVIGWGSTTVFGKRLSLSGFDTRTIMGGRFLMGLLTLLVMIPFFPALQFDRSLLIPNGENYLRIVIMVLISGALGMWLYYQGLSRLPAKTTAIAEMFFPFFAVVVNWLFLGKQLNEIQLLGGGILILGSLIIQLKKY